MAEALNELIYEYELIQAEKLTFGKVATVSLDNKATSKRPTHRLLPETEVENGSEPKLNEGVTVENQSDLETHKRKSKMKKNNKNSIYQSLFNFWNLQEIANHRKLTNKMKRCINGRLDEGFTEAEIMRAIANYAKILKSEEYWWTHRWTALIDFLNRGIDKFKDWSVAHINYLKSDKKLAGLKDKKEAQFEASLHKIITDCKKCDGQGSTPGKDGTHECSCRKKVKELRKEHKDATSKRIAI